MRSMVEGHVQVILTPVAFSLACPATTLRVVPLPPAGEDRPKGNGP